jgi:hypothetical protein
MNFDGKTDKSRAYGARTHGNKTQVHPSPNAGTAAALAASHSQEVIGSPEKV